jgi:hypothetical protein
MTFRLVRRASSTKPAALAGVFFLGVVVAAALVLSPGLHGSSGLRPAYRTASILVGAKASPNEHWMDSTSPDEHWMDSTSDLDLAALLINSTHLPASRTSALTNRVALAMVLMPVGRS